MTANRIAFPDSNPELPDLPAMGDQVQGYEKVAAGVDLYGPAGLPQAIAKRVVTEKQKALAAPDVRARMRDIAFFPNGTTLDEMGAQRRKDIDVVAIAIKAAGLKAE